MILSNTKIITLSIILIIIACLILNSSYSKSIKEIKDYNSELKKYYIEKFGPKRVLTNTEADVSYQNIID